MRELDVVCLGEALVDLLPERRGLLEDCDRFEACAGGAPANVATGLARLGRRVAFRGVIGDDPFGRLPRPAARGGGRPVRLPADARAADRDVVRRARRARRAELLLAERALLGGQAHRARRRRPRALARATWLHVGSSAHVLPDGQTALRAAIAAARALGTRVSFDPNVRAHLWDDLGALRRLCADVLPACSLREGVRGRGRGRDRRADPARAAARLAGARRAARVRHARRSAARSCGAARISFHVTAEPVEVVDTTGAGDAFVAGCSRPSAAEGRPRRCARRSRARDRFANRVAGRVCTRRRRRGAPPRRRAFPLTSHPWAALPSLRRPSNLEEAAVYFQDLILKLQTYWASRAASSPRATIWRSAPGP